MNQPMGKTKELGIPATFLAATSQLGLFMHQSLKLPGNHPYSDLMQLKQDSSCFHISDDCDFSLSKN
jgi:hypothetical protein